MLLDTRDFGKIEVQEKALFHFAQPIFGFEEYTEFAILQDDEIGDKIIWLQSIENPSLCFILMDPTGLSSSFNPVLPDGAEKLLGEGDCFCWLIAVVGDSIRDWTVNLKCPVFINTATKKGAQLMLDGDYPVRYPLSEGGAK